MSPPAKYPLLALATLTGSAACFLPQSLFAQGPVAPLALTPLALSNIFLALCFLAGLIILTGALIKGRASCMRTEQARLQSEERFRSFFESSAAAIGITTLKGDYLQVNPAACQLLGYRESELLGRNVLDIIHPDDRALTRQQTLELINGTRPVIDFENRYLRKDGSTLWGHSIASCVRNESGTPLYIGGQVVDISARKQTEEELREANRELDAFAYTVAHDLRTPLTPIIGYADYLLEHYRQKLDETALSSLDHIHKAGRQMLATMNDLLTLAKMGRVERPACPIDTTAIAKMTIESLASQSVRNGVEIKLTTLPPLRIPDTQLIQLFDNLIGNAIRYASRNAESIEVGGRRNGDRVSLFVRDHGPGIPTEDRERIFDAFYRGSTGSDHEGSGIGLATVLKIAKLYDGRAWVEETPGGGSTFHVELLDSPARNQKLAS